MDYTHSLLEIQNWMILHHKSYKVIFILGLLLLFIFLIHTFRTTKVDVAVVIFNIILFTSLFTEISGSAATEYALIKSGEIKKLKYASD